jgi:hypothetical protein
VKNPAIASDTMQVNMRMLTRIRITSVFMRSA